MKIATWNVNSIKARLPNALDWLREAKPDIVLLQELKCVNEAFPAMEIEELGYNLALNGQKTYNGVAILSKYPLEDIVTTLPGEPEDTQARYIEAVVSVGKEAIRVVSVYVPNGQDPTSDKFPYKLRFMERLANHMETLLTYDEKLVVGGDYNVGHQDIDVFDAEILRGTTCFHPEEQKRFRTMLNLGFTDIWRSLNPTAKRFSWWDYRGGGYSKNEGLRIDYLLLSPRAVDAVRASGMDEDTRAKEKASDHIPVWCELS
ncbi:MAG: exodeoxyribonuclease III [Proteobacteria bacterium]|nr:exodeoxyribonuclease III [Pseudomonadota bacterium]